MKKTKSHQKYPKALKRKIAQEYLSGKFSYAVAAEEYGLSGRDVVKEFVRWYRKNYDIKDMSKSENTFDDQPESKNSDSSSTNKNKKLEELQKELEAAKLKIAGLETLIDVAEKELSIDIRKKSGSKRSE